MRARQSAQGTNLLQSHEERIIFVQALVDRCLYDCRSNLDSGFDGCPQRVFDEDAKRYALRASSSFCRPQNRIINVHRCFHAKKLEVYFREVKSGRNAETPISGLIKGG